MHRWSLLNLTVQGFSLNLTVRGVSNKHSLLTFFIDAIFFVECYNNLIISLPTYPKFVCKKQDPHTFHFGLIRAGIHKMLVRIANMEDPDQTASLDVMTMVEV